MKYKLFSLIQRRYQPTTPLLLLILLLSFVIRVVNFSFPAFTENEVRIASRGYRLATTGKDELGRPWPFIFNSLTDYQLPLTSYITMLGTLILGRSELGARLPFILIGTVLVLLTYKVAQVFSDSPKFRLASAFIVGFSPTLIFLSKTPNDSIILAFLLVLLFLLLTKEKIKNPLVILITIACAMVSKHAWFITPPFILTVLYTLKRDITFKKVVFITSFSVAVSLLFLSLFLTIPQAKRSLLENNFSIFNNMTIINGINRLRGQGINSGWPPIVGKLLFNKTHFFSVGLLNWLESFNPDIYFGRFDSSGEYGFTTGGAFEKILIIPTALGLIILLKRKSKIRLLAFIFLSLTFPLMFTYPFANQKHIVITLPFIALIIAAGLINLGKYTTRIILFLVVFELALNTVYLTTEINNNSIARPYWLKPLIADIASAAEFTTIVVSDNVTTDISPYLMWYMGVNEKYNNVDFPYKFVMNKVGNVYLAGDSSNLYFCENQDISNAFLSRRDLLKLHYEDFNQILSEYKNQDEKVILYRIPKRICID